MALSLNTQKSAEKLRLCVVKKSGVEPPAVDVEFILDVSGSFDWAYRNGTIDTLISRLFPWAMVFDPDKKAGVITFSNDVDRPEFVTDSNYENYASKKILNKVSGYGSGTQYVPAIERLLEEHAGKSVGKLAKLFGAKDTKENPVLAIFITDGEAQDQNQTLSVLKKAANDGRKMFVIFVGVGQRFPVLEKLYLALDNVSFAAVNDLEKFVGLSDDELNELLISDNLIRWVKQ